MKNKDEETAFMVPQAQFLTEAEAQEYVAGDAESGFYGRLSASGYLDCTDWEGPYPKAWMALRNVCDLFEVDTRGNSFCS